MAKILTRNAAQYVEQLAPFEANNLFAREYSVHGDYVYIVYSYRTTFPILLYTRGYWMVTITEFSNTTSRHLAICLNGAAKIGRTKAYVPLEQMLKLTTYVLEHSAPTLFVRGDEHA